MQERKIRESGEGRNKPRVMAWDKLQSELTRRRYFAVCRSRNARGASWVARSLVLPPQPSFVALRIHPRGIYLDNEHDTVNLTIYSLLGVACPEACRQPPVGETNSFQ